MPKKNRLSYWRKELLDQLAVLMGGRVAEEIFVGDISSGAQNDIERATHIARSMVCEWGMSDALGTIAYEEREDGGRYLGLTVYQSKKYSEATAMAIDIEVKKIVEEAHQRGRTLVETHRDKVQLMTDMLMEFESLDEIDVHKIMDGAWDIDDKRKRLKEIEMLHKKQPPPVPTDLPKAEALETV